MRKPGCIPPVFYFVNGNDPAHPPGYLIIAPYSDCPTPPGYRKEFFETLAEARTFEKRMQIQDRVEREQEYIRDWSLMERRNKEVRDKLYARMTSSDCTAYEKEFIRGWMELKDEEKKKKYEQRYLEHTGYLWALHNDVGDRGDDTEKFRIDSIEVK